MGKERTPAAPWRRTDPAPPPAASAISVSATSSAATPARRRRAPWRSRRHLTRATGRRKRRARMARASPGWRTATVALRRCRRARAGPTPPTPPPAGGRGLGDPPPRLCAAAGATARDASLPRGDDGREGKSPGLDAIIKAIVLPYLDLAYSVTPAGTILSISLAGFARQAMVSSRHFS